MIGKGFFIVILVLQQKLKISIFTGSFVMTESGKVLVITNNEIEKLIKRDNNLLH